MNDLKNLKQEIIEIGEILSSKNLVAGFDGNISLRYQENLLITASSTYKGKLKEEDIVLIDKQGNILEGRKPASSEYKLHVKVYENREDINAVIHAHPVMISALSLLDIPVISAFTPESYTLLGDIPVAPYKAPGSDALAESILHFVKECNNIVLAKHGSLNYANSLFAALNSLEKVEALCHKLYLLSANPVLTQDKSIALSPEEKAELDLLAEKYKVKRFLLKDASQLENWPK